MIVGREGMEIRPVSSVNGRKRDRVGVGFMQRSQCVKSKERFTFLRAFCLDVM